jgi:glycosyltransferase involved in cell wall biosynthesis
MASGTPVAAAAVGGVPDLVQHNVNGLLFDPTNPGEIRSAIEALLTNTDLRNKLSAAARKSAEERFRPKHVAARHLEIYREVIARFNTAPAGF